MARKLATWALYLSGAIGAPAHETGSLDRERRQDLLPSNLSVDLDYAIYKGTHNSTTGLNVWKGIRYAAAPIGSLRWASPQTPTKNRTTQFATTFGPNCPQAYPAVPNAPRIPGDEDCLILNVYAPKTTSRKLPVLVWIHGGGYGFGDGTQDLSTIINANDQGFIGVSIQYRLGAFGFLSSSEVKSKGTPNAGILDMAFALEWVQKHIAKFGGDNAKVTISGESAGAGGVMLLGIARGGSLGSRWYRGGIAASPYLPAQYNYDAAVPTTHYYDFSSRVGCGSSGNVLECLRGKDSATLQQANQNVTASATYGSWAFLPVTDGSFITSRPSTALAAKAVNGEAILVGNNVNEGALFVPPIISTLDGLKAWLQQEFPTFTDADVQSVLNTYPSTDEPVDPTSPKFATNGLSGATAINVSQAATGQQQRGNNILAEATFICPSYWLNTAYTFKTSTYHYQYSVPFASHTDDISAYFGPSTPNQSAAFSQAFRQIWGNFIKNQSAAVEIDRVLKAWPKWDGGNDAKMANLNETGGVPYETVTQFGVTVTQFADPGLKNDFKVVDAYDWEGGRGKRCEFWKSMADKVSI
ncbi:alpha/beta-hydrolase [Lentithecium fluviatile CBS 122367]|uniref:Carboxylic ester hydrolase n=1 Tax=Lentithecium fluviatile CBS 122367 TaxID=1168545 RepID=A0A6G1JF03_9PLEO|nr:alpha/beta-hydrolase [Lentithecium fluviatile CBS 122367]